MTLTVLPHRCWELTHLALDSDGEGWPHFYTPQEALGRLADDLREARADLGDGEELAEEYPLLAESKAEQLDLPCWVVTCSTCGAGMHWDGRKVEHGSHWSSEHDALEWLDQTPGWFSATRLVAGTPTTVQLCSDCATGGGGS